MHFPDHRPAADGGSICRTSSRRTVTPSPTSLFMSAPVGLVWLLAASCGCRPAAHVEPPENVERPSAADAMAPGAAGVPDDRPAASRGTPGPGAGPIRFADVTRSADIDFAHFDGGSGRRYIVEYVSSGVALVDYDNDGRLDLYLLSGGQLPGSEPPTPPRNRLYRNEGGWRFTDVTDEAGVGDPGHALGVAAADFTGNGFQDIYINNHGPNTFLINNGDGTFTRGEEDAKVVNGDRVGAGVCGLDIDGNGHLDLFVANYVQFSYEDHSTPTHRGVPVYPSPLDHRPDPDTLFRNNGDGTFTDVSEASGIARHAGTGMGAVCFDFDGDGDTDIFVCNDVQANFLYRNDGRGRFEEVALLAGVAYDFSGLQQGSMGADCGDYDGDGWLDLFTTTFQGEMPTLYRNSGQGYFEDVTVRSQVGASATNAVTWGTGIVDFDNDGYPDIFMASGHLMDNIRQQDASQTYASGNFVLRNRGDGVFEDVTDQAGDGLAVVAVSRGTAFADLDNDGRVDGIVLNSGGQVTLLRNETETDHDWLQVRLRGIRSNPDGVGARVVVESGERRWVQEVHCGRGYQSHHGMWLHFGLGDLSGRDGVADEPATVDRLTVHWIGGPPDTHDDVPVNRRITLVQGQTIGPHAGDETDP